VIVSVEVAGFAPGVTDDGEIAQVGIGDGPVIAHESSIVLPKGPFIPAMVNVSVP
jgi:hypothetical protein